MENVQQKNEVNLIKTIQKANQHNINEVNKAAKELMKTHVSNKKIQLEKHILLNQVAQLNDLMIELQKNQQLVEYNMLLKK